MKVALTNNQSNRSLLLFFAGWGMDSSVFADLKVDGFDTAVVWDYREMDLETELLANYDEIVVIAWSMGVWAANQLLRGKLRRNITRCVAVNGTLSPIDDLCGIPVEIYDKTSLLPDAGSVARFMRRICGGASAMKQLLPNSPQRPVDELRDELVALRRHVAKAAPNSDSSLWDEIVISGSDLIFPPANMQRAWEPVASRITLLEGAAHMIDFTALANRVTLNKLRIGHSFSNASRTYTNAAGMQAQVARDLIADAFPMLQSTSVDCSTEENEITKSHAESRPESGLIADIDLLEIGSGTGVLTDLYQRYFTDSRFLLIDLAIDRLDIAADPRNSLAINCCDAETEIRRLPDDAFDFVFSSSTLQWFHSPLKFLEELRRVLRPGGSAHIAYFAPGTLQPLADEGLGLHYPTITADDLRAIGFDAEICDRTYQLTFDNPADLLRHFRATGVNGTSGTPLPPSRLHHLLRAFRTPTSPTLDASAHPYTLTYRARFLSLR